jgi:hypothetical protein
MTWGVIKVGKEYSNQLFLKIRINHHSYFIVYCFMWGSAKSGVWWCGEWRVVGGDRKEEKRYLDSTYIQELYHLSKLNKIVFQLGSSQHVVCSPWGRW